MHWGSLMEGVLASVIGFVVAMLGLACVAGPSRRQRGQEVRRRRNRARLQSLAHELAANASVLARMARDIRGVPAPVGASAIARSRVRHVQFLAWELLLTETCDGVPLDLAVALRDAASATRDAVECVESGAAAVRAHRAEVIETFCTDEQEVLAIQTIETRFVTETSKTLGRAAERVRAARAELAAHLASLRGAAPASTTTDAG